MVDVFKAEMFRLRKEKIIIITLILTAIYVVLRAIPFQNIIENALGVDIYEQDNIIHGIEAFDYINYNAIITFITPFIIISVFTGDIVNKTIYGSISSGLKKTNIFIGKYAALAVILLVLSIFCAVCSTLIFGFGYGFGNITNKLLLYVLLLKPLKIMFVQLVVATFDIILSLIIKSSALVVILFFVISLVESMLVSFIHVKLSSVEWLNSLSRIMPSSFIYDYLEMKSVINLNLFICLIYCLTTMVFGIIILKKRDL